MKFDQELFASSPRLEVKPGMIGLSGGDQFMQKQIRKFTKSDYSHSFTVINGPEGVLSALETTETRVCVTPFDAKYDEDNWIDIWELTQATQEELNRASKLTYKKYAGKWYGYLSYIWFLYIYFYELITKKDGSYKQMWKWCQGDITCTELTSYWTTKVNVKYAMLFEGRDLNTVTPQRYEDIMKANPDMFRFVGRYK